MNKEEHEYEKIQNFNFITKILHRTRYRNLELLIRTLSEPDKPLRIVDIGCGPGEAFAAISNMKPDFDYLGIELREDFSKLARDRYDNFDNFEIICDSIENHYDKFNDADLIIGLETFEHIPESIVVRVIEAIGNSNFGHLYLTVPNEVGPAIFIKNVGSFLMGYSRYKEYKWSETIAATFYKLDSVERHGTGHKGFDWRWLAQTLRQNVTLLKNTTSPMSIIPKFASPNIGFVCANDDCKVNLIF